MPCLRRIALWCGLLALAVAAAGCQRGPIWNLVPVEGTITKDGHPLRGIEVILLADPDTGTEAIRARGRTDETGRYRLRTDNGDDGAVIGKHRVVLFDTEGRQKKRTGPQLPENSPSREGQRKAATLSPRVPPRYGRFNETPLRVEVQPGPQVIDFDVKATDVEVKLIGVRAK